MAIDPFEAGRQFMGSIGAAASQLKDVAISATRASQNIAGQMAMAQGGSTFSDIRPRVEVPSVSEASIVGGATGTRMNLVSAIERSVGSKIAIGDITSAAYESLISGGQVGSVDAYIASQKIAGAASGVEAYEMARVAIEENQGVSGVFTQRLEEVIGAGTYDATRLQALSEAKPISREFGATATGEVAGGYGTYRPAAHGATTPEGAAIASRLEIAAEEAGIAAGGWKTYEIEDLIRGKTVTTPMLVGRIGEAVTDPETGTTRIEGTKVQIPAGAIDTRISYGGENQTARYYTKPSFDIEGGPTISYAENYTRQLEQSLLAQESSVGAREAVHAKNLEILNAMNERDTAARATGQWGMPWEFMTSGERAKQRIQMAQAVATRVPTKQEAHKIFAESLAGGRTLLPIGSPGPVQKGVYATQDIREVLYGPLAPYKPIERRPEQQIRSRWSTTPAAKEAASAFEGPFGESVDRIGRKITGGGYEKLLYGGEGIDPRAAEAYGSPSFVTVYSGEGERPGEWLGVRSEEQGILRPETAELLEAERTQQVKLEARPGQRAANEIKAMGREDIGRPVMFDQPIQSRRAEAGLSTVSEGRTIDPVLGVERDTGKLLFLEEGERVIGAQRTGVEGVTAYKRITRRLQPGEMAKFYTDAVKHELYMAPTEEAFGEALYAAGGAGVEQATGQRVQAVISGAILDKDPGARAMQQLEAMSIFAGQKLKGGNLLLSERAVAEELLANPMKSLGVHGKTMPYTELQFAKRMVDKAWGMGFSQEELASTFGHMPQAIAEQVFDKSNLDAVKRPGQPVIGNPQLRLGTFAGEFASTGSYDPSTLAMLSTQGKAGQLVAQDLAGRIQGKEGYAATERMYASMLGTTDPSATIAEEIRGKLGTKGGTPVAQWATAVGEQAQDIDLGRRYKGFGGSSLLHIPGRTEMPEAYKTVHSSSGEIIASPFERALERFQGIAQSPTADVASQEAAADMLRREAETVWGRQAAGSGKTLGAVYATGTRESEFLKAGQTGISLGDAESQFDKLIALAKNEDDIAFLKEQRHRLIGEGRDIQGLVTRSPAVSQYAVMPTRLIVDPNLPNGMVSMSKEFSKFQMGNRPPGELDISATIPLAGDFDGDHYVPTLISNRDASASVEREMGHARDAQMGQYFFQQQALKEALDERKVVQDLTTLTPLENLTSGFDKLTAAPERAGKLNTVLSEMRLATMATYGPEKTAELLGLMEIAEQKLGVGGKHGAATATAYDQLIQSRVAKDPKLLEAGLSTLFGSEWTKTGEIGSQPVSYNFSARRASQEIMSAVSATEQEVQGAMAIRRIAKNRHHSRNAEDALRIFNMKRTSIDPAQVAMQARAYGPASFSGVTSRTYRQAEFAASRVAKSASRLKNPAIAIAAIGAGLLLAAPAVSGTLSPPRNKEGADGGRNMPQEGLDMAINGAIMGGYGMQASSGRIMESPRAYQLPSRRVSGIARITMGMDDLDASRRDIMQQANALGQGARVRVNIRDDRNRLDPNMLAQKIHERL